MIPSFTVTVHQNDYGNNIPLQITDTNGNAIVLDGYTVKFHMWKEGNPNNPIVTGDCIVEDSSQGWVYYTWQASDLANTGVFLAELQVEATGYNESTDPFEVIVEESPP